MTANVAGTGSGGLGRQTAGHPWFHRLSRVGLAARGLLYLLVGWLAVRVGMGEGGGREADRGGALQEIAGRPGGAVVLWLLVIGLAGLALWGFSEARYGQPVPDGRKARKRLAAFGRGVVYTVACAGTLAFVLSSKSSSSDQESKSFTARAMSEPGGRWLVLAVGIGVIAWGAHQVWHGASRDFRQELKTFGMDQRVQRTVEALGVVGHIARGVVAMSAGVFLAYAAITFDPGKAKGLDGTLRELAATPAGPWLLIAVALGLVIFGVYSLCESRWRKVEAVRS
ncbi:DUF1206 domain-containing protein [Actinomadura rudentiformis]|uniref:DUF1206 domain-containing protein n=1 Tax=Actinomadura rudentiformis TaxID=359158 RepID=A0A6H9YIL4_9ACTN|nr:DUF1206 domain-containing protein [Actinomadura rudentiformis]KAB2342396.1 DUF1206 domain-containing protein [Actinomadura rudentiformis]